MMPNPYNNSPEKRSGEPEQASVLKGSLSKKITSNPEAPAAPSYTPAPSGKPGMQVTETDSGLRISMKDKAAPRPAPAPVPPHEAMPVIPAAEPVRPQPAVESVPPVIPAPVTKTPPVRTAAPAPKDSQKKNSLGAILVIAAALACCGIIFLTLFLTGLISGKNQKNTIPTELSGQVTEPAKPATEAPKETHPATEAPKATQPASETEKQTEPSSAPKATVSLSEYISPMEVIQSKSGFDSSMNEAMLYDLNEDGIDDLILFYVIKGSVCCSVYSIDGEKLCSLLDMTDIVIMAGGNRPNIRIVKAGGKTGLLVGAVNIESDPPMYSYESGDDRFFTFNSSIGDLINKGTYSFTFDCSANAYVESESSATIDSKSVSKAEYDQWISSMQVLKSFADPLSVDYDTYSGYTFDEMIAKLGS